jgi:nucleotidyltransferase/DNA polymerase involved in DNA repair
MTTLEAWEKERERRCVGSCAAYRERIHRLEAERDRLREALKLFVKLEDVQRHYPIEVALARAVLGETEGKE